MFKPSWFDSPVGVVQILPRSIRIRYASLLRQFLFHPVRFLVLQIFVPDS